MVSLSYLSLPIENTGVPLSPFSAVVSGEPDALTRLLSRLMATLSLASFMF